MKTHQIVGFSRQLSDDQPNQPPDSMVHRHARRRRQRRGRRRRAHGMLWRFGGAANAQNMRSTSPPTPPPAQLPAGRRRQTVKGNPNPTLTSFHHQSTPSWCRFLFSLPVNCLSGGFKLFLKRASFVCVICVS